MLGFASSVLSRDGKREVRKEEDILEANRRFGGFVNRLKDRSNGLQSSGLATSEF